MCVCVYIKMTGETHIVLHPFQLIKLNSLYIFLMGIFSHLFLFKLEETAAFLVCFQAHGAGKQFHRSQHIPVDWLLLIFTTPACPGEAVTSLGLRMRHLWSDRERMLSQPHKLPPWTCSCHITCCAWSHHVSVNKALQGKCEGWKMSLVGWFLHLWSHLREFFPFAY